MRENQNRVFFRKKDFKKRFYVALNSLDFILRAYFAHVDGIYFIARVLPAHVCTHVRHVLRAISAVRTIESRRLAALEFRMVVKIILVTEDTRTPRTGEFRPLDEEIAVDGSWAIYRLFLWHHGHEFMPVDHRQNAV